MVPPPRITHHADPGGIDLFAAFKHIDQLDSILQTSLGKIFAQRQQLAVEHIVGHH